MLIQLTVTMPVGETLQDCVADAPSELVAVSVKLFGARDCAALGVQLRLSPLSQAPVGAVVKEKDTVPPEGSVSEIE